MSVRKKLVSRKNTVSYGRHTIQLFDEVLWYLCYRTGVLILYAVSPY